MGDMIPGLTRAELSGMLQRNLGLPTITARRIVDGIIDHINAALERGEEVKISGFGTFHLIDKPPRIGRNPRTCEEHVITARRVVSFRPSQRLKDTIAPPFGGR